MPQSKKSVKLTIDILMSVLYILLLCFYATGLVFHEIAGIAFAGLVFVHLVLNRNWLKALPGLLKPKKGSGRQKLMVVTNFALFIGFAFVIITGLLISQVLFPVGSYNTALAGLHKWSSYICGGIMLLHGLLHLKYLASGIKRALTGSAMKKVKQAMVGAGAAVLVGVCVYNAFLTGSVGSAAAMPATTFADAGEQDLVTELYDPRDSGQEAADEAEDAQAATSEPEAAASSSRQENSRQSGDSTSTATDAAATDSDVTLAAFLGSFFCTACPKHCSLAAPRCGRSQAEISEYTAQYEAEYGASA